MSNTHTIENAVVEVELAELLGETAPSEGAPVVQRLGERGLTTAEYAIGVVMVIALVGGVIYAINTDSFRELAEGVIRAIFEFIKGRINLP